MCYLYSLNIRQNPEYYSIPVYLAYKNIYCVVTEGAKIKSKPYISFYHIKNSDDGIITKSEFYKSDHFISFKTASTNLGSFIIRLNLVGWVMSL